MIMSRTTSCGAAVQRQTGNTRKTALWAKSQSDTVLAQTILSDSRGHHFFTPDSWNALLKIKTKSYESGLQPTKGVFYLVTMFQAFPLFNFLIRYGQICIIQHKMNNILSPSTASNEEVRSVTFINLCNMKIALQLAL